jgi:hypothetical protein
MLVLLSSPQTYFRYCSISLDGVSSHGWNSELSGVDVLLSLVAFLYENETSQSNIITRFCDLNPNPQEWFLNVWIAF